MYLWSKIAEVPLMDINVIVRKRLGMDTVKKKIIYIIKRSTIRHLKKKCVSVAAISGLDIRYPQIRYEHGN